MCTETGSKVVAGSTSTSGSGEKTTTTPPPLPSIIKKKEEEDLHSLSFSNLLLFGGGWSSIFGGRNGNSGDGAKQSAIIDASSLSSLQSDASSSSFTKTSAIAPLPPTRHNFVDKNMNQMHDYNKQSNDDGEILLLKKKETIDADNDPYLAPSHITSVVGIVWYHYKAKNIHLLITSWMIAIHVGATCGILRLSTCSNYTLAWTVLLIPIWYVMRCLVASVLPSIFSTPNGTFEIPHDVVPVT